MFSSIHQDQTASYISQGQSQDLNLQNQQLQQPQGQTQRSGSLIRLLSSKLLSRQGSSSLAAVSSSSRSSRGQLQLLPGVSGTLEVAQQQSMEQQGQAQGQHLAWQSGQRLGSQGQAHRLQQGMEQGLPLSQHSSGNRHQASSGMMLISGGARASRSASGADPSASAVFSAGTSGSMLRAVPAGAEGAADATAAVGSLQTSDSGAVATAHGALSSGQMASPSYRGSTAPGSASAFGSSLPSSRNNSGVQHTMSPGKYSVGGVACVNGGRSRLLSSQMSAKLQPSVVLVVPHTRFTSAGHEPALIASEPVLAGADVAADVGGGGGAGPMSFPLCHASTQAAHRGGDGQESASQVQQRQAHSMAMSISPSNVLFSSVTPPATSTAQGRGSKPGELDVNSHSIHADMSVRVPSMMGTQGPMAPAPSGQHPQQQHSHAALDTGSMDAADDLLASVAPVAVRRVDGDRASFAGTGAGAIAIPSSQSNTAPAHQGSAAQHLASGQHPDLPSADPKSGRPRPADPAMETMYKSVAAMLLAGAHGSKKSLGSHTVVIDAASPTLSTSSGQADNRISSGQAHDVLLEGHGV